MVSSISTGLEECIVTSRVTMCCCLQLVLLLLVCTRALLLFYVNLNYLLLFSADFGSAGQVTKGRKVNSVIGTPYWMAPEVCFFSIFSLFSFSLHHH